jgi:hypothetical protein
MRMMGCSCAIRLMTDDECQVLRIAGRRLDQ